MKRQFDDVLLGSIELFCLAAEAGRFTAAAAGAGVTPAAVSRSVARLEARLGIRLFVRTTRQIRLTDEGRDYFEHCRQALAQLVEAERQITGHQLAPAGTLRISVPTTYGHFRVLPALQAFRMRHPQVRVEVHIGNRNIDFVEEGYDLAIRARPPADSKLIARPLEAAPLVVVAAPRYLAQAGHPATLDELAGHECIQFVLPSNGRPVPWEFMNHGRPVDHAVSGSTWISEDPLGCITVARAGGGLLQTCRFLVEDDLRRGSLVEVLQAFGGRARTFSLVYPHGRHLPQRVRVFVEHLLQQAGRQ